MNDRDENEDNIFYIWLTLTSEISQYIPSQMKGDYNSSKLKLVSNFKYENDLGEGLLKTSPLSFYRKNFKKLPPNSNMTSLTQPKLFHFTCKQSNFNPLIKILPFLSVFHSYERSSPLLLSTLFPLMALPLFPLLKWNRLMYVLNLSLTSNFSPVLNSSEFYEKSNRREEVQSSFQLDVIPQLSTYCMRFLEFFFNRNVYLSIQSINIFLLSPSEKLRCEIWIRKLKNYTRVLGAGFFLTDTIHVFYLALKFHNPHLFMEWLHNSLCKISFWKYRSYFHFLRYSFRFFFWPIFREIGVGGVKFKLKGKISVSGNARTRTIETSTGLSSKSTIDLKAIHLSRLVPSFTGVMGLQFWLFLK